MSLSINAANEILRQYDLACNKVTLLSANSAASIYCCGKVVIKQSDDLWLLETEALMLRTLKRAGLPVPKVIGVGERGLVTQFIESSGHLNRNCEIEAADMLASLHTHTAKAYGFEQETTIGPFRVNNDWNPSWVTFFAEQRIFPFAVLCEQEGQLSALHVTRIEKLLYKLPDLLHLPKAPALLHGDIWGGNILTCKGKIAAFIDPACFYGHPEMELAFIAMFNTFKEAFYARYDEHHTILPGFFEERCHVYQLFPYLVHVRAFGETYISGMERILKRFGC